ncbi:9525_t:CDS:2, partial [Funneliformis geosporum]
RRCWSNVKKQAYIFTLKNNPTLKQLNLNPLSIAKFFYQNLGERGVEQPFIHPALYLTYREFLKKDHISLFKEEFEVPDITNEMVIHHLENICHRYQRKYKNGETELFTCDLQFKANKLAEKNKVRGMLSRILKKFTEYSAYTLEQLKENDRHFRFISNERQKELVIEKINFEHARHPNLKKKDLSKLDLELKNRVRENKISEGEVFQVLEKPSKFEVINRCEKMDLKNLTKED